MQNKKFAALVIAGFAFLALFLTFISAVRDIVPQVAEYRAAERVYQEIREVARPPVEVVDDDAEDVEPQGLDWVALRHLNPDIVGWLVVDGTTIDYPIARGPDNDWYLHRTVTGERNSSGSIFMDYRNDTGFFDPHTLIFGHNMQNGTMFAGLHDFTGGTFRIYTPHRVLAYEVFAKRTVSATDTLYLLPPLEEHEGRIVTLSTCVFRRDDLRFVVQGRLLEG